MTHERQVPMEGRTVVNPTSREGIALRLLELSRAAEETSIEDAVWAVREAAEVLGYVGPAAEE